jgi:hypothetical protein
MPPFSTGRTDDLDWQLVRNGPITLFRDPDAYLAAVLTLADGGYQVTPFDAARWVDKTILLDDLATSFGFPDHFGHNLDALDDCLGEVARYEYGADPAAVGSVIAIDRIDALAAIDRRLVQTLLDILAHTSRTAMLHGHRLLVIASTADPELRFDPVGATPINLK